MAWVRNQRRPDPPELAPSRLRDFRAENADRVMAAFRDEIDRAPEWGFTAGEVGRVKRGLIGTQPAPALRRYRTLASTLNSPVSTDHEFLVQHAAAIQALAPMNPCGQCAVT